MASATRPEFITDDILEFLDDLRDTGVTNMFGARPYITEEYPDLTRTQAEETLLYWMESFGDESR